MKKNIPYGKQHITPEDLAAVNKVLLSDFLTQGPTILELEKAFTAYVGSKYAVAVANGTAALHLCALALDVKEGDKVITTPITFAASANCVRYAGGEVLFADIDPNTYTLDISGVRALLEASPKGTYKGIIPVDFSGYPVNLEQFKNLADEYGLWIIEDACHAPGGYFKDSNGKRQKCGNSVFADLAIFSFHPVKHIAAGEGGMITTNSKALYEKLLLFRTHGITKNPELLKENHGGWYYEMQVLGYNYRLTDFQAALALSQLSRADVGLMRREAIAKKYDEAFAGLGIVKQKRDTSFYNAHHLYIIEVENRKALYDYLREAGIFSQVHYIPVHTMPYYKALGWRGGDFPNSEAYYERCLSLPMYPSLTEEDQLYVIQKVKSFIEQ